MIFTLCNIFNILPDSVQQAKPKYPPEVELPNFARPTASKLTKEDGKSSMYNSLPDKPKRPVIGLLNRSKPQRANSSFEVRMHILFEQTKNSKIALGNARLQK